MFSVSFLTFVIYAALIWTALAFLCLVTLLIRDLKNKSLW